MRVESGPRPPDVENSESNPPAETRPALPQRGAPADPDVDRSAESESDAQDFFEWWGSFFAACGCVCGAVLESTVDAIFGLWRAIGGLATHPSKIPGELVENAGGAALLLAGRAVSDLQMLAGVESAGRDLTPHELAALRQLFGESIDFSRVVVKDGDQGLASINDRPFVLGNVIYLKERGELASLAHEMVHVWQYQNGGPDYLAEALAAQLFGDGYDWQKALAEGKVWSQLNPEQQGQLIEDAFAAGFFPSTEAQGERRFVHDGRDYTAFLSGALESIRAGRGAP
jgi:hypothetical protein